MMDFLDDFLPTRPTIHSVRPNTESDLEVLRVAKGSSQPPRKKLRYKHHSLARNLAAGWDEAQAAVVCGFAPVTVSILKKDPAFNELVKFYLSEEGKEFDYVRAQMLGLGQKFLEEMERRVAEDPTRDRRSVSGLRRRKRF